MNVLLNVGYERYVVSIEDAAKVMKIIGEAKLAKYEYADEDAGLEARYVLVKHNGASIAQIDHPVADA
jgi:hypothetical protein